MHVKSSLSMIALTAAISLIAIASCSSGSGGSNDGPDVVASADATLKSLTISVGTLVPVFDPATTEYTVALEAAQTALTVTGAANDENATVSDKNGVAQALKAGETAIVITVTAADRATVKHYTVKANRKPNVYTAGNYYNGTTDNPCYWINDQKTDLPIPTGTYGFANAIVAQGGSIYVAGGYYGTTFVGCYWKDATRIDLPGDGTHEVHTYALAVDTETVYVAGYYSDGTTKIPCYWKDGVRIDLSGTYYEARGIAVSNGKVYIAGYEYNGSDPCYWVDGIKTTLDMTGITKGYARKIMFHNGSMYVFGRRNNSLTNVGCYWTVSTRVDPSWIVPGETIVNDMIIIDDTPVFCGSTQTATSYVACVWSGSNKIDLPSPDKGYAHGIAAFEGTTYTGGSIRVGTDYSACYWVNATRVDLPGAGGEAECIYVGD